VALWMRITLYIMAGIAGWVGAASGLSRGLTLLLIAVVAFPVVMLEIRYRRKRGEITTPTRPKGRITPAPATPPAAPNSA
jgi:hypothetical protein